MKTTRMEQLLGNVPCSLNVDWNKAIAEHDEYCRLPIEEKLPRVYQLETTSICNLKCNFCPLQNLTRPKKEMSMELFETIVRRDMKWTKAVELFGFGEPFADSHIEERLEMLKSYKIKVTIATNGLLAHKISDEAILNIDYLVWDIDAVNEEQYEKVRGGNYQRMLENLTRVVKLREGKGFTSLQYIDLDNDPKKCKQFLKMYEGVADECRIKFLDSFAGQVNFSKKQEEVKCMEPLYGVSIWSNGDVVMCDRDCDSKHKLGNLHKESLIDIWAGDKARYTKACHRIGRGEKIDLCSKCEEWQLTNLRNVPELTVNMFKGGKV